MCFYSSYFFYSKCLQKVSFIIPINCKYYVNCTLEVKRVIFPSVLEKLLEKKKTGR